MREYQNEAEMTGKPIYSCQALQRHPGHTREIQSKHQIVGKDIFVPFLRCMLFLCSPVLLIIFHSVLLLFILLLT